MRLLLLLLLLCNIYYWIWFNFHKRNIVTFYFDLNKIGILYLMWVCFDQLYIETRCVRLYIRLSREKKHVFIRNKKLCTINFYLCLNLFPNCSLVYLCPNKNCHFLKFLTFIHSRNSLRLNRIVIYKQKLYW